jgi:radical SAM superfamily enzyme YgiQ (UPF0313 family)
MKMGKTVVRVGMHPSMALKYKKIHCNSLCIGEADTICLTILEDFKSGSLKKVYRSSLPEPHQIASPKPDVFSVENKYDWHASLISVTRGCPFGCDWCNVPLYQGNKIRLRPMETVTEEIRKLSGKEFYITDDMIMLNRPRIQKYMMELCEKIKDYKVNMFLSCSPAMNTDPAFLDTIASAGAKSIYTVFASDPISQRFYARHPGIWQRTLDLVKQLEVEVCAFALSVLALNPAGRPV